MSPALRTTLSVLASALIAAWMGWEIAQAEFLWPTLFGVVCLAAVIVRITGLRADIVLLAMIAVGYVVGNRGFAQLMPAPSVPLLPAEVGLLFAGGWLMVNCALQRRLPFENNWLNLAIVGWLVIGTVRVCFDVRFHGLLALRDFATVYYAGFFFIAQDMARDAVARRFLLRAFWWGFVALLPMYALYQVAQDFFLSQLTIRGMPLIYYKGDLLYTSLMAGAMLLFHAGLELRRRWLQAVALLLFLVVMGGDSRASQAGGLVAFALLALGRRWRFPAAAAAAILAGVLTISVLAQFADNNWAKDKLHSATDRLRSIVDVTGQATYRRDEGLSKSDNNRFRLVWWENVVRETSQTNPVFGLGFGADLSNGFLREYYPELTEEFTTRSPHNIAITVFGRMGVIGLITWALLCIAILRGSLRLLTRESPGNWGLAVVPWVVIVSSCFGVVLEGPMGAVPFWILLGLMHAELRAGGDDAAMAKAPAETELGQPAPIAN